MTLPTLQARVQLGYQAHKIRMSEYTSALKQAQERLALVQEGHNQAEKAMVEYETEARRLGIDLKCSE